MQISVVPATEGERLVLANLIQLSMYDFTNVKKWAVQEDGRFEDYGLDGCWTTNDRHPFFIRTNGILVDSPSSTAAAI